LNLEGVLRHSVADALGSLGVIATGAVIALTGWEQIDPLVSLAIASLILASSWRLIADPFAVLMEAAPARLDPEAVAREMVQLEGVREVHDLHVWTLTAGFEALAAHVVVDRDSDRDLIRRQLEVLIRDRYGISHTTLQMEEEGGPELLSLDS
jgi:cobalt-zinc-cadmium efflux system protein